MANKLPLAPKPPRNWLFKKLHNLGACLTDAVLPMVKRPSVVVALATALHLMALAALFRPPTPVAITPQPIMVAIISQASPAVSVATPTPPPVPIATQSNVSPPLLSSRVPQATTTNLPTAKPTISPAVNPLPSLTSNEPSSKVVPSDPPKPSLSSNNSPDKPQEATVITPTLPTKVNFDAISYRRPPVIEYPARSVELGESGLVQIELLISTEGKVKSAKVIKSSGFTRLDKEAVRALSRATFSPYTENGVKTEAVTIAPIEFDTADTR